MGRESQLSKFHRVFCNGRKTQRRENMKTVSAILEKQFRKIVAYMREQPSPEDLKKATKANPEEPIDLETLDLETLWDQYACKPKGSKGLAKTAKKQTKAAFDLAFRRPKNLVQWLLYWSKQIDRIVKLPVLENWGTRRWRRCYWQPDALYEIRCFFQRAIWGYDEAFHWNISGRISKILVPALKQLRDEGWTIPNDFALRDEDGQLSDEGVQRWKNVLDKMIDGFQAHLDLNGSDFDWSDKEAVKKAEETRKKGLKLFAKYFAKLAD